MTRTNVEIGCRFGDCQAMIVTPRFVSYKRLILVLSELPLCNWIPQRTPREHPANKHIKDNQVWQSTVPSCSRTPKGALVICNGWRPDLLCRERDCTSNYSSPFCSSFSFDSLSSRYSTQSYLPGIAVAATNFSSLRGRRPRAQWCPPKPSASKRLRWRLESLSAMSISQLPLSGGLGLWFEVYKVRSLKSQTLWNLKRQQPDKTLLPKCTKQGILAYSMPSPDYQKAGCRRLEGDALPSIDLGALACTIPLVPLGSSM